jgi:hypothetical protein
MRIIPVHIKSAVQHFCYMLAFNIYINKSNNTICDKNEAAKHGGTGFFL